MEKMTTVDFTFEYQGEQVTAEICVDYVYEYRYGRYVENGKVIKRTKKELEEIIKTIKEEGIDNEEEIVEKALKDKNFVWWLEEEKLPSEYEELVARVGKHNANSFFKNWR